jgi:hypothetical protein
VPWQQQLHGTWVGSPLYPVIVNSFMKDFKEMALDKVTLKPLLVLLMTVWPHG